MTACSFDATPWGRSDASTLGVSPHQYLVRLKLDRAKAVLARGASVTEACSTAGFESLGTFSTTFTRRVGLAPSEWWRKTCPFVQSLGLKALWVPGCFLIRLVEHV
jgi:methylphosphotriester-DNA--protein-cysteine methyltransferase